MKLNIEGNIIEYLHTASMFYNSKRFLHYAMGMREKTKSVSLRRNRDYMSHFVWTYEFNRGVYQFYTKARENPKIGYMKRMKQYWDNVHPEFTNFNAKQLRQ